MRLATVVASIVYVYARVAARRTRAPGVRATRATPPRDRPLPPPAEDRPLESAP